MIKIDGGLSTALEVQGADLKSILWTGELIEKNPDAIIAAHKAFILSGAQIVITSSYQVSFIGKEKTGKNDQEISSLLDTSTSLARIASEGSEAKIAASIGPYGAALGDGSEYRGNYKISDTDLQKFHEKRIEILANTKPDLFAVETIPSLKEAQIIENLLSETEIPYWLSFSCRDNSRISEGESFSLAVSSLKESSQRIATGINCTNPEFIFPLLKSANRETAYVIYPNSGKVWKPESKTWVGKSITFGAKIEELKELGVEYLGGCCGVGPSDIASMKID